MRQILKDRKDIIAFERKLGESAVQVILNYSEMENAVPTMQTSCTADSCLIHNYENVKTENGVLYLRPFEALVFRCGEAL